MRMKRKSGAACVLTSPVTVAVIYSYSPFARHSSVNWTVAVEAAVNNVSPPFLVMLGILEIASPNISEAVKILEAQHEHY